jgi:hypothetical protein
MAQSKRKQKQKAGRHSLLTGEITRQICSFITAGCYDYAAAEACGISLHTFKEWMARGEGRDERSQDKKYATFATAIRHAKATARISAEVTVKKSDPKWWLARMYRDRPGEPGWTGTLEVTGKEGAPLTVIETRQEMASRAQVVAEAVKLLADQGVSVRLPTSERRAIETTATPVEGA